CKGCQNPLIKSKPRLSDGALLMFPSYSITIFGAWEVASLLLTRRHRASAIDGVRHGFSATCMTICSKKARRYW
ncbi:MAG: hypothetical protein WA579_02925, partial [Rhodomicrobium sp.]